MKKKIAITMGDPAGIGPEVVVSALSSPRIQGSCLPLVIGQARVMEEAIKLFGLPMRLRLIDSPSDLIKPEKGVIGLIEEGICKLPPAQAVISRASAQGGRASLSFIKKAVVLALKKEVDAIVTAPISKKALKMAGLSFPGHTEILAELTNTKDLRMMLVGGLLRVILVTIHTALKNVPEMITRDRVFKTILFAKKACEMLGISSAKIAVSGLNPHAGEAGLFGDEEEKIIIPAVKNAQKQGIKVSGPYPPDTVFRKASKGEFDIVVCMYHDQGLIPLKLLAFEKGVNVTVGLPIIRTSPDHGTAYDIAWKGLANPESMIEAIMLAVRLRLPEQPPLFS